MVRKWSEPKSIRDIQVFLGFANFYRRFIQVFSRIATSLISTLITTNKPALSRNNGSGSASSKNDNNKPAFKRNDGDSKVDRFGSNGMEHAKKSGKSKSQKTSKSRELVKSGKNSLKSENSPNFGATNTEPSFLTPGARKVFNCLRLTFTKAPILWHFDPKYHI